MEIKKEIPSESSTTSVPHIPTKASLKEFSQDVSTNNSKEEDGNVEEVKTVEAGPTTGKKKDISGDSFDLLLSGKSGDDNTKEDISEEKTKVTLTFSACYLLNAE